MHVGEVARNAAEQVGRVARGATGHAGQVARGATGPAGQVARATMPIGEVAQRTGLSVKTVRYYSDLGLVPEATRSASGYRRYDATAVVRLEFVRTLRELGLDLATIRRVLEKEDDLPAVAAAHAEALGAQIRLLRLQRAALRNLARRPHTPHEVERMSRLAQATADERRRLMNEFLDSIFAGVAVSAEFESKMRAGMPELPDDPSDEQVDAWLELADLIRDQDFRDRLRAMSLASFGTADGPAKPLATPTGQEAARTAELVTERASAAREAGIDPASPAADPIVNDLVAAFADSVGRTPDEAYRRELLEQIRLGYEPRAERYWQLIAIINGWPPIPSTMANWSWFIEALSARL
ncbi:MAG TPA: MerR family transcriptional regulator [Micromonosporaceae bacterium]|nr:MerR family transcriptional regulator [Micromonosporaceae bacterium]